MLDSYGIFLHMYTIRNILKQQILVFYPPSPARRACTSFFSSKPVTHWPQERHNEPHLDKLHEQWA